MSKLTLRQREVAVMVSKGLSNKEISERLLCTEKTVKFHLTSIYEAIGVTSRAQLIVKYLRECPSEKECSEFLEILNK